MPGNLFEGNPVDEGTTRRGTDTPVHRPEIPAGSTLSSTSGLSLREQLERQGEIHLENPRDGGAWWAAVYGVAQSWTRQAT